MEDMNFGAALDAAGGLSVEEHETLIEVLRHRVADANRQRLYSEVQAARREFAEGQCQFTSPSELMQEVLS